MWYKIALDSQAISSKCKSSSKIATNLLQSRKQMSTASIIEKTLCKRIFAKTYHSRHIIEICSEHPMCARSITQSCCKFEGKSLPNTNCVWIPTWFNIRNHISAKSASCMKSTAKLLQNSKANLCQNRGVFEICHEFAPRWHTNLCQIRVVLDIYRKFAATSPTHLYQIRGVLNIWCKFAFYTSTVGWSDCLLW